MAKPDKTPAPSGTLQVMVVDEHGNPSFVPMPGYTCDEAGNVVPIEPASPAHHRDQTPAQTITVSNDGTVEYGEFTPPQEVGNVTPSPAAETVAGIEAPPAREEPLSARFKRRMEREGRWREMSVIRDRMMVEAKKAIPDKDERREWVAVEMDRMYPPLQTSEQLSGKTDTYRNLPHLSPELPTKYSEQAGSDSGQIQGLSDVPADWPELPSNASLAAELGWVQANRLRIVTEKPGRATVVQLERAATPAPSWAALGWLETSIRSYAKFIDVAAKVSGGADDESAVLKRERKSVDEVRALLREMEAAAGTCPSCGRPFEA